MRKFSVKSIAALAELQAGPQGETRRITKALRYAFGSESSPVWVGGQYVESSSRRKG